MEGYKRDFIKFLLSRNALRTNGDFKLKSGRLSPWFVNLGDLNDGQSTGEMGRAYAQALIDSGLEFDIVYGIPEKGVGLVVTTAIGLAGVGMNKPWFFTRKMPKGYGEATQLSREEKRKAMVVGKAPDKGNRICLLDDVLTTAKTKHDAMAELGQLLDDPQYILLAIAVDREEVAPDGRSAVEEFSRETGIPVVSIVSASDVYQYLQEDTPTEVGRLEKYLRVYGTDQVRSTLGKPLGYRIIETDRSVIPACDVPFEQLEELVRQTANVPNIGGYKIPARSGRKGWEAWVAAARKHTNRPLIYDHQKAGTDIPDTAKDFMVDLKGAGFDAVILFPQSGPETERAWIYHALDQGLKVIVGGRMTHPAYAQSEGGWISDEGALEMYRIAAKSGVNHFVVPGNKPDVIKTIKDVVEAEGVNAVFMAPGFVAQGGKIGDAAKVAGDRWHAIVGRGIYEADDKKKAAEEHTSQLAP